jgi:2,5-diamino-6-(ribosylamino)-4(3H)-pyrimidinone 5'-phosphate reductase
MHDGILIGIGTAVNDNPQLNGALPVVISACCNIQPINVPFWLVRYLPFPVQNTHFQHYHHPRPLILDPHLRLSPTCKLIVNAAKGAGVAPWVISARPPKPDSFFANEDDGEKLQQWEARLDALLAAGVTLILVEQETIRPSFFLLGKSVTLLTLDRSRSPPNNVRPSPPSRPTHTSQARHPLDYG